MKFRSVLGLAVAIAALSVPAAAHGKGTVYSTGNSNELQAKPIAADGSLGVGTATPTGSAVTPRGIAITPDARFLYMTTTSNNLLGFDITGATPAQVSGSPYNVTDTFGHGLAVSPNGQFLYTLNQNGGAGSASIFTINGDGSLTKVGGNVVLGYQGDGIAIGPAGSHLYITDTTNNTVHSYAVEGNGTISQVGTPQATGTGPKGIAVSPGGSHVFTAATGGQISAFPVQADGSLAAANSTVATGQSPQTLAVTQNGQFLYTADFPSNPGRISAYAIAGDGSLTPVPGQPFTAVKDPYGIDAAPGSRFVYSTSFDPTTDVPMNGYSIGADGALADLPGSPYATQIFGSEFQSVAVTPNQGPSAMFTAVSEGAGQAALFNATSSSDSDGGTVARYDWDFGDGTTLADGGATPSHVYQEPGDYQVTLTVTDNEGCSNQTLFTGQTADCNPSTTNPARVTQTLQVGAGTAPDLRLFAKKQELARKVTVKAKTADETDAVAKGKLKVEPKGKAKKTFTLKKATKSLDADEKTKIKPKLSKKAYKQAKKALKNRGKVSAKVNVKVTDDDADTDKDSVKVKITKP